MDWTVWDKLAAGGGAVAIQVIRSHGEPVDPEQPEGEQQTVVDESRTLDRVGRQRGDSSWVMPIKLDTLAKRLAPLDHGATRYRPGWVLLVRLDAPPGGIPAGQKRGPDREVPLVDLEAGTATWYTLIDLDAGELAAGLAARRDAMRDSATTRFRAVRDGGTIVVIGGNPVPVATVHNAAVELREAIEEIGANGGPMKVVTRSRSVVPLTVPIAEAMLDAIRTHVRACQEREAALYEAIAAATNDAALDLIDVQAGTVGGVGGWPAS